MRHSSFRLLFAALTAAALAAALPARAAPRIVIAGDSLMKLPARALVKRLGDSADAVPLVSIGSGLARLDLYNWPEELKKEVAGKETAAVVLLMGANDNQPMQTAAGAVVQPGTPEWRAEYAARVAALRDALKAAGVGRLYWLGLPDVREESLERDILAINAILREQIAGREGLTFMDTASLFSLEPGKFSPYIRNADTGMPLQVRSQDGTHFNKEGAEYLAGKIAEKLKADLKL